MLLEKYGFAKLMSSEIPLEQKIEKLFKQVEKEERFEHIRSVAD